MKKMLLLLLLAAVAFGGACAIPEGTDITPNTSVSAAPKQAVSPETALITQSDIEEPDEYIAELIATAKQCRVSMQDAEYFLDTDKLIGIYDDFQPEFPLCRQDNDTGLVNYMGTTGFSFQHCGRFIYIKSDVLQEDWPVGEMTRIVNLDDGVITPFGRNVDIFVPEEDGFVYYTYDGVSIIYQANPSLEESTELSIRIPEREQIEAQFGDMEDLCTDIEITKVADGWIYFSYEVFEYEGPGIYAGHYRISTDGSHIETTAAGQYYSEDE